MSAHYDIELLMDGAVIGSRRSVVLPDLTAAWPLISALAWKAQHGAKIRVLDKEGRIVILTGVAAARSLFQRDAAA